MLQITNIRLPLPAGQDALRRKAAKLLRLPEGQLGPIRIVKASIDARKKSDVRLVYSIQVSTGDDPSAVRRAASPSVTLLTRQGYAFPPVRRTSARPPVIVGMGPAGLFAALFLARAGIPSIVLERGRDVDSRAADVERFWATGQLDPASNVQFGEGGAGTFSDGKLTTGTHDGRISAVLDAFVAFGAPEDVAYSHKPHIGTDILRQVVKAMRLELVRLGCDVRFGHKLAGLSVSGGALAAAEVDGPEGRYTLPADALVLAPGHSARDTFAMLDKAGLAMEQKNFAIGVRIEHRQADISRAQYGDAFSLLPPSDYKLACHLPSGRSAFTFCVCPGGQVVASASAPGLLVTNGMSCRARDGENCNGGFLVNVGPGDFPGADPLAGVRFQEAWESAAFQAGGGGFLAPAQTVGDFLARRPSSQGGSIRPTYRPGVTWTALDRCLPDYVTEALRGALPLFDRKVRGFACPEAVLTGVETRSSSPVRILRDERFQSSVRGIYPCGEGCGYAGGIVSAAVDGIRVAEAVACL